MSPPTSAGVPALGQVLTDVGSTRAGEAGTRVGGTAQAIARKDRLSIRAFAAEGAMRWPNPRPEST